jgi:hypothetical protein
MHRYGPKEDSVYTSRNTTNTTEPSRSLEAESVSDSQGILCLLNNPKILYRFQELVTGPTLKQQISVHNLSNYSFRINMIFIIIVVTSRRMRWAGHVARMGERRSVYRILVWSPEGKRPLGKLRRRWEDNIKMNLRKIEIDGANWIRLAQDRVQWRAFMNTVMNLRVP